MVSNTENNNEAPKKAPSGIPEGKYRLIGWDIDTTGRRLIDEICQIAAYTPTTKFAQYVMPYAGLNPFAQRRHNIRVVTVTRYRMLKDLKTNKFLKTKSEISALTDFLTWLEENRGDATDGIILVFHEVRKMAPAMLLEALRRYNLQDRFAAVVKGFANSYLLAENKCAQTVKSFSLRVLSRVLLDKEEDLDNAADRARLSYSIVQHLGQSERQDVSAEAAGDKTAEHYGIELVRHYAQTITAEETELAELKVLLERQNTFRPVFKELLSSNWANRQYASRLRRLLVENSLDFGQLKCAWETGGKPALELLLKKVSNANEKDYGELLEILDCYFDPEKKPVQPKPRPHRNSRSSQKENKQEKSKEPSSPDAAGDKTDKATTTPNNENAAPVVAAAQ